jgi:hypothetical protein
MKLKKTDTFEDAKQLQRDDLDFARKQREGSPQYEMLWVLSSYRIPQAYLIGQVPRSWWQNFIGNLRKSLPHVRGFLLRDSVQREGAEYIRSTLKTDWGTVVLLSRVSEDGTSHEPFELGESYEN